MDKKSIIKKTEDFVEKTLPPDSTGHDFHHAQRVRRNALMIAKREKADLFPVELAALLHDIADYKFHGGTTRTGARLARNWLRKVRVDEKTINHVCGIIEEVSFRGAGVKSKLTTIEGKTVQDADRLDALGAIGIARAFAFGGYKNREIYNPGVNPVMHKTFREYKKNQSHTINHFYEKLLLIKKLMNTKTGKEMAHKRDRFIRQFLKEFLKEWEGKA